MSRMTTFRLADDLVEPFKSWCKSRDRTVTGVLNEMVRGLVGVNEPITKDANTPPSILDKRFDTPITITPRKAVFAIGQLKRIKTIDPRTGETTATRLVKLTGYDEQGAEVWEAEPASP